MKSFPGFIIWRFRRLWYTKARAERLLDRLRHFYLYPVIQTRGLHRCPFCSSTGTNDSYEQQRDRGRQLGSAEVVIIAGERVFLAPDLIVHYIDKHGYWPPRPFVVALESSLAPPDEGYFDALRARGIKYPDPECGFLRSRLRVRLDKPIESKE